MNPPHPAYVFRTADGRLFFRLMPGSDVVVGRKGGPANVQLDSILLSRRHMRLVHTGDTCVVELLRACCDIYVNGHGIAELGAVRLQAGDEIRLPGVLSFNVEIEPSGDGS